MGFSLCDTRAHFYKVVLDNSAANPISFNLQSITPVNTYIKVPPTAPTGLFGEYIPGSNCFMPADRTGANQRLIIIVRVGYAGPSKFCKLLKIFTTSNLVACSGTTTPWTTVLQFSDGSDGINDFKTIVPDNSLRDDDVIPFYIAIEGLADGVFEEQFFDAMVMEPIDSSSSIVTLGYNPNYIKKVNDDFGLNSFSKKIQPVNYIPRLIREALPGYFLGLYPDGSGDHDDQVLQFVEQWAVDKHPSSILINAYIKNSDQMVSGQVHKLFVVSKGWKTASLANALLEDLNFEFRIRRFSVNQIQTTVFRGSTYIGFVNFNSFSTTNFLYIGLVIGHGIVHFQGASQARPRLQISIVYHQIGQKVAGYLNIDLPIADTETIYTKSGANSPLRYTSIRYESPSGNAVNTVGLRIAQVSYGEGVFPSTIFGDAPDKAGCENRCMIEAFRKWRCYMPILLNTASDGPLSCARSASEYYVSVSVATMLAACKVPSFADKCATPKPGYTVNLDTVYSHPYGPNHFLVTEYNEMRADDKVFYKEYTDSSSGVLYLVRCPQECIKLLIIYVLKIFR